MGEENKSILSKIMSSGNHIITVFTKEDLIDFYNRVKKEVLKEAQK